MSTREQEEWKTFAAVIRDDSRAAQLPVLVEGALAEGRRQGWADAVLEVLDARHIAVSDEIRDHVLGCGDTDKLRLWVRRSVTATPAATALFDEPKLSARELLKKDLRMRIAPPWGNDRGYAKVQRLFDGALAEGMAEGEARGLVRAVLGVLSARGIDVPDAMRERIAVCTDVHQLGFWLRRSITATNVYDLIE